MALEGTIIINNPFWWSADDKFFKLFAGAQARRGGAKNGAAAAKRLRRGITSESLRNLEFPLDWQAIIDYVGLPAFLKPFEVVAGKMFRRLTRLRN